MKFPEEFFSRGTNDSSTKFIAASSALDFYERLVKVIIIFSQF